MYMIVLYMCIQCLCVCVCACVCVCMCVSICVSICVSMCIYEYDCAYQYLIILTLHVVYMLRVAYHIPHTPYTTHTTHTLTTLQVKHNKTAVEVSLDEGTHGFSFDQIFGPDSKQQEVFDYCAVPLVHDVLQGYNATIFACKIEDKIENIVCVCVYLCCTGASYVRMFFVVMCNRWSNVVW